jgi:hypothetical protein
MSTSISISAERQIWYKNKAGELVPDIQKVHFDAYATPTFTTLEILRCADPAMAYTNWVLGEFSHDVEEPVYAQYDIFGDGERVGTRTWNPGKEHAEKFWLWMTDVEEQGFTIKYTVL